LIKKLKCFLLVSAMFFMSSHASAGISVVDGVITVEGEITDRESEEFVRLGLEKIPSKVIFKNSPGGTLKAGLRIGRWMTGKNITTVVNGYCASTCALAFLGGDRREFSTTTPYSFLYFHLGSLSDQKMVDPLDESTAIMFRWVEYRTKQLPINVFFKQSILNLKLPGGGLAFFPASDEQVSKYGSSTFICRGDEARRPIDCEKNDAISAMSLGIITPQ
jgi:hypothetical protein